MTPGQLDAALVRRHLLAMDEALQVLRRHQGRPIAALTTDREALWVVERGLQLCAQNALDVASHIAASAGRDVSDYGAAIDRVGELGILPAEFVTRFRGIAGFRNVIVHGYLNVDPARVHELLNDRLGDFAEFARHVSAFVESREAR